MLTSARARIVAAFLVLVLVPIVAFARHVPPGRSWGRERRVGAIIPNAEVVLIDIGTGTSHDAKSGPEGGFVFPNLQPGRYTLTATASGFQPVTLQEIIVQTARSTTSSCSSRWQA